jgi:hypothetical protein
MTNSMPMTWWLGKHTLALPESSADWSLEKLRHVIRHELAHIQRHDCQSAWITRAALALLWFHPLIWILNRSLNTTREVACDDLALANSSDLKNHENYARHLLDIVTTHSRTPQKSDLTLAMTRNNTDLQRCLTAILDQQQDRRPVSTRSRYLALPLWLVGLTALASLSACRTVEPVSPSPVATHKPTSGSQVEVSTTVIELEDPAILRKFFNIKKDEIQFASVITVERMEEILKKLPESKSQTTKLPKVVTTIGRKGRSERTREFIYPTEYSPPQFPKNSSGIVGGTSSFPVTPASPTSFETKILGLTCEFTPNLDSGQNIALEIDIDHSHFLGFVNYGSPIMAPATNAFGFSTPIVVTENRIEMPLFRSHRFNTSYTIQPGHVVALIGLSLENSPNLDKATRIFNTPQQTKLTAAKGTLYLIHPEILETP